MTSKTLILAANMALGKQYAHELHGRKADECCIHVQTLNQAHLQVVSDESITQVCINGATFSRHDGLENLEQLKQAA